MRKYEILSITSAFPPNLGGMADHVFNINLNLVKQGHSVTVIAPKHLCAKISQMEGNFKDVIRINSIYLLGWPYSTLRHFNFPADLGLQMKSIIRNGNFDVIHAQGQHYPISWLAINLAHKYGIPSVLTVHGMYGLNPNVMGGKSQLEELFNKYVFAKILSKTSAVIGTTEQVTNYAKKYGKELPKYFTIPNGVNTTVYKENLKRKNEYREKYFLGKDKKVILFCGRFEEVKGITEFTQAAKTIIKNKDVEIIIVGAGPLESYVRTSLNGLDRIHILKWQPPEHLHEIYIASDIFVIPSKFEGLPIALIEAMNAGLHIVYTPVGGMPEILSEYFPKTMLTKSATEEIHNVLTNLISNFPTNNNINDSLSYAQKFDWNDIAGNVAKVYAECIDD